jgi:ATP-dependent exoDNAse (exonuclease V) beta subunit
VIRGGHEELPLLVVRKPDGINTRLDSATKTFDQLQSLKEEVRLLYVTMTRAKKSLTFIGNLSSPRSSAIPASWAELLGAKL